MTRRGGSAMPTGPMAFKDKMVAAVIIIGIAMVWIVLGLMFYYVPIVPRDEVLNSTIILNSKPGAVFICTPSSGGLKCREME